jgi:hypothetical protein
MSTPSASINDNNSLKYKPLIIGDFDRGQESALAQGSGVQIAPSRPNPSTSYEVPLVTPPSVAHTEGAFSIDTTKYNLL